MEKAKFKFNNGNSALLCSKCNTILKTGPEMSYDEILALRGLKEINAQYCDKCNPLTQL